ncbi:hypothetical protein COCCU_00840 [Corynebacterium occultum]|uniref:PhoU domain-containing protein n=1 Tax=Corynebacterium occultum TaxID=2675219 RepID=A0A6B8W5D5_9CORY|nr:phosphate signaling complex protein PhoU [Corynebacterium occultum]QGU06136.1 hypothetical protein COCCU_00840 [Corynebacterium occultum]
MRPTFREDLDDFSHDLIIMFDMVREIMAEASDALIRGSLDSAEDALSHTEDLRELRSRCDQRAMQLLALQGPIARDLRQVVSSIYIVDDFDRMGALAMHIARSARRRHPDQVVPEEIKGQFEEFIRLTRDMTEQTRNLLISPDTELALTLAEEDDAVDELHNALMVQLTQPEWSHSAREAVDAALLSRFYERYADHCVNVASRLVYLNSGLRPEEYRAAQEPGELDIEAHYQAMERKFHRGTLD